MEATCLKLDELLVEYVQTFDDLQTHYQILENSMKQGFFNLGKARYTLGGNSITPHQYDMNMKATFRVTGELLNDKDGQEGLGDPSSELRRRNISKENVDDEELSDEEEEEESSDQESKQNKIKKKPKDPLYSFGYLVPATLRKSQNNFRSSLSILGEMAVLKQQLTIISHEYSQLLEEKKRLSNQVSQAS